MLRNKRIDRICSLALVVMLLLTFALMGAADFIPAGHAMGYEDRLFDQSRVHTLDIVIDGWDEFLETCTSEEYSPCTLVVDGENQGIVGIRAKGNTSLSSVAAYGNNRYSFKIEFDHYQTGRSYHGLDKLSLNNLIQDKTLMKDYLAYTLMNVMGVASPLCSYVQINVNGEYWGLYLAVEGVEDSFLSRNYGSSAGKLYKPDSMSFGGGRGNGRDFDMSAMQEYIGEIPGDKDSGISFSSDFRSNMPDFPNGMPGFPGNMPGAFNDHVPDAQSSGTASESNQETPGRQSSDRRQGLGGGRGSADVKLQYIDDSPDSYSNIFGNAKTDITEADQQRLIQSLKALSEGDTSVVDIQSVIRYFVVHNFMCNDDSYTGMMIHNYYLHESDGVLSMIPWDYNLSFGGFSMGENSGATSVVNTPIDSLVSTGDDSDRPMAEWITGSEESFALYHEIYSEFVSEIGYSGWLLQEIGRVQEMLSPYVAADPTAFFSPEEFAAASEALREFCSLRFESISGQLNGTIPSTGAAQRAESALLIDASGLSLSDLGEFGMGGGGFARRSSNAAGNAPGIPGSENSAGQNLPDSNDTITGELSPTANRDESIAPETHSGENTGGLPSVKEPIGTESILFGQAPFDMGGTSSLDGPFGVGSTPPGQMPIGVDGLPPIPAENTSAETDSGISPGSGNEAPGNSASEPEIPGQTGVFPEISGFGSSSPSETNAHSGKQTENLILFAVSLAALLAALIYVKFCRSGR